MKLENVGKLVAKIHDKTQYFLPIRNLKQTLIRRLVLKKVPRVIKFNKKTWLKPYIDMNPDLRKKQQISLKKNFSC